MSQVKQSVFVVVFVGGLLTLVSAFFYMMARGDNRDAPPVAFSKTIPKDDAPAPANGVAQVHQDEDAPKPANQAAKPTPPVPSDYMFLKRISITQGYSPEDVAADKGHNQYGLCLDPTGAHVLAVTRYNTYCFDVATGKLLQTYHSELANSPGKPQFVAASPDARFVAVPSADGKDVSVREAATARQLGAIHLSDSSRFYKLLLESRLPSFTPAGDFLLVSAGTVSPNALYAVSTKTGTAKLVDMPKIDITKKDFSHLLPVPQWSTFLVCGSSLVDHKDNPSNLFAIDYTTGKETPLTCLSAGPQLIGYRPLVLSPDGRLLLVKNVDTMQVCEWCTNRVVFTCKQALYSYNHPCFTPDGTRVAVIVRNNGLIKWVIDPMTGKKTNQHIDDEVQLFDIARQVKIGSFTPHADGLDVNVRALAMSADGKSFAVWAGQEITLVDFQSAFGVDPLPPGQHLSGPETLPLKQPPESKDAPRKPK
jgi:hypothetical protein